MNSPWLPATFIRFERLIRYCLVGAGLALFYSLLTAALYETRIISDPTLAGGVAFIATQPLAFLAHSRITYPDVTSGPSHGIRFGVAALAGFFVAICSIKLVTFAHWPYWAGLVIGWFLVPMVNYLVNAAWVFRARTFFALRKTPRSGR